MTKDRVKQLFNQRDLEILMFLMKKTEPTTKTEIYDAIEGKPNRIKDNLDRLEDYHLIRPVDGKKLRQRLYEVIDTERNFIKRLIKKINKKL